MLVTLGARTETSDDAIALLSACHGRIRKFIGLAQALGERTVPLPEALDVAAQVERYFRIAFPLHIQDEDLSVLPRLLGRVAEVDAALEQMRTEHPVIDPKVEELVGRLQEIGRAALLASDDRAWLCANVPPLAAELEAHLVNEERVIFPAASKLFEPALRETIRDEMRARRQPR